MSDSAISATAAAEVDVALIGAGIMSATLGAFLRTLEPQWSQIVFERLDAPAEESSSPWNNAGTGHSALCELNYTPEVRGRVEISKAVAVNEKFQVSRQFWSYQVNQGVLPDPREWINPVPHVSFGRGEEQVNYLRKRYEKLANHPLFPNMRFADDRQKFEEMLPLMAEGRPETDKVAISWTDAGTDINYGALTKQFLAAAQTHGTEIRYGHVVENLRRDGDKWESHRKKPPHRRRIRCPS